MYVYMLDWPGRITNGKSSSRLGPFIMSTITHIYATPLAIGPDLQQ